MLRNNSVKLFYCLSSHFLIVLYNSVNMITANTDLIEDKFEE